MEIELTAKEAFELWRLAPEGPTKDKLAAALDSDRAANNISVWLEYNDGGSKWFKIVVPSASVVSGRVESEYLPHGVTWRYLDNAAQ